MSLFGESFKRGSTVVDSYVCIVTAHACTIVHDLVVHTDAM